MTSDRRGQDRRAPPAMTAASPRTFAWLAFLVTGAIAVTVSVVVPDGRAVAVGGVLATGVLVTAISVAPATMLRRRTLQAEEQLTHTSRQASLDVLTGLPNRHGLLKALDLAVAEAQRDSTALGVLFLDLDRFKVINDTMGHETGDDLLKQVAKRIVSAVRASDVVARFGGDEFVVICRGLLTADSSVAIARQILHAFDRPIALLGGADHVVTPSIGVATMERGKHRTARELVRDADAAMYRAKKDRSGLSVFDEAQRRDALNRLDVEQALRVALEDSKLDVHYQPIVDGQTRAMVAYEALVRWNRPGMGMIGPGAFLDVAEEAGLIAPLGDLVMREAVAQTSIWNHGLLHGRNVRVGVNVAERQLIDPQFVHRVERVVEWAGLAPWLLTLEITEDVIVEHLDSSLSVLRDLKTLGVSLSIDDFGTGQSSLSYVKRLDMVDSLKIDKSFVQGLGTDSVDEAIVHAIVAMARALELDVVAEGVETQEQAEHLVHLGVTRLQGFLFYRPLSAANLERELVANHVLVPRLPEHPGIVSASGSPWE